ncbi:RadC family protein [Geoalkalibacter halelectricus]|uniref:DNA repair protein RadC n=1 Tax=Geoalkalibacter halelectricus TaxID=2847045 RepID=A0ABY5ZRF7_9BACT|nr:DNA repair protein RadC [Geoalkalibacter halelectricus]MDO3378411.1 DNA repair protein RadC [Geoalkalibacter halelectricus]UWZ80269.1 DNA repair protein RadC [Geoalkalibacter halelectricus]
MSDTSRRIKDWPEEERPREKLLARGAEALSDAELLALILRTGDATTRTSALDHARLLLARFGGLRQLAAASIAELCLIKGIGPAKAVEIQAVFQIARRFADARLRPGDRFTSSEEVFRSYHERLRDHKREVFYTLLLDSKNRLIREVPISEGSLTASIVHPREVFAPVIRESASAVLFVHNHPSGDPTPSREDLDITRRLKDVGELVGVRVLDHIVVGDGRYVSFADRGLL